MNNPNRIGFASESFAFLNGKMMPTGNGIFLLCAIAGVPSRLPGGTGLRGQNASFPPRHTLEIKDNIAASKAGRNIADRKLGIVGFGHYRRFAAARVSHDAHFRSVNIGVGLEVVEDFR